MSSARQETVEKSVHLLSDFFSFAGDEPKPSESVLSVSAEEFAFKCVFGDLEKAAMKVSRIARKDERRLSDCRAARGTAWAISLLSTSSLKRTPAAACAVRRCRQPPPPAPAPFAASGVGISSTTAPCTAGSWVMWPMWPVSRWCTNDFFVMRPASSAKRATSTTLIPNCRKMLCTCASGVSGTMRRIVSSTNFERSRTASALCPLPLPNATRMSSLKTDPVPNNVSKWPCTCFAWT
mmetsp:Transcript_99887/g.287005  ORF Transcript_99887/g.287005 Transcript_99887/m.287005 type:complete len:237 (-) Transcript_99887:2059-2769(-)